MTTFISRVKSKIVKNNKSLNSDGSLSGANANHEQRDINSGILIVKLVKNKHDKGLGLTVSGGIDRASHLPVVSHLRLGGIADRSESLVIGDKILAVNNKKTENLTHQEIVDLLRNAGQHVHLRIQYKLPTPDKSINSSCKTAVIQLKKEADGFGIVARESPQTSVHGYRPLVVASVRPGSAAHSRGVIHVGDRLLAINGQALLGITRDDVVLLLKHAHNQVSLQIEYDVYHKEPVSTRHGTYIAEVEKPAPTVSLGLSLVEDTSGVFVISDIIEGGVVDRLGVLRKEDQIISINGTFIKDLSMNEVVDLLARSGSRVKIEFLTARVVSKDDDAAECPDRYGKVDSWVSSAREFSDDLTSVSTPHDEASAKDQKKLGNDSEARERLRRALPLTPHSNLTGYDNTSQALMADPSPYEEISELIGNSRRTLEIHSDSGSDRRHDARMKEGLYSQVRKPRSNSLGTSASTTGRNSPLFSNRNLGSRRSSFSNSDSPLRGRRQFSSRSNGFWSSGSLKCSRNAQLCRQEYVEVNLTADSQGFGLSIAESFIGRQSVLVIAELENGGPAERSGVLQVNDEVLGINDTDVGTMTAEQCNGILQSFGTHANILIAFTVAESIVATSGRLSVKLPKHYFGLGITFTDVSRESDEKSCIVISHVRKGSLAYRTGVLHIGDKLIALNGRRITRVEDAIALIDAIPLGDIVSVTVQKEQDIEDESSGVIYTIELSKQGRSTVGIMISGCEETGNGSVLVSSLVPGTVADMSGAVHVGDRILAVNDILVKNKSVEEIYKMLDLSGENVKLRLQSSNSRRSKLTRKKDPGAVEIPDMSALHRVSAWAEIFNELDQIVATTSGGSDGKQELRGKSTSNKDTEGQSVSRERVALKKTGDNSSESQITATVCSDVESANDDLWKQLDELWEKDENIAERRTHASSTRNTSTDVHKNPDHDLASGKVEGKCISIRYVVHEKCVNPSQETRERTTQRACVYFSQDARGKLACDSQENKSRAKLARESRESSTQFSRKKSLERTASGASGYETDNSTTRTNGTDLPHCGRGSQTETETFTSMDSFDISNDADDRHIPAHSSEKIVKTSDVLETRTYSVQKTTKHGFGFSLMPDKFKQEVYIASVIPGGPCDGMLQPLDKITKIDDRDLTQLNIYEIVQILQHGPTTIKLCVVRNLFNTYTECRS